MNDIIIAGFMTECYFTDDAIKNVKKKKKTNYMRKRKKHELSIHNINFCAAKSCKSYILNKMI